MPEPQTLSYASQESWPLHPAHRWLALLAAVLAWGFDGVEQGVYGIMTRQALKDLLSGPGLVSASDTSVGFYFSLSLAMWLWGAALGGVVFGRFGDRYGRVRGLLISVSVYSLFTGLSAFVSGTTPFLVCRFIGAIGLGGTWPLCVALVVEAWEGRRRSVLAGAIGAASNVGFLVAASYSRVMLGHGFNWRWIIGMGMPIGLLSLPVIFAVREPSLWKQSRARQEHSSLADLFSPAYRRSTIVGSLLSTVALLGTWGSFLWLATYVDQLTEGTPMQRTGKAIVTQWQSLGQIAGGFIGGLLAGWLGNKSSWRLICVGAWISVMILFGLNRHYGMQMAVFAALAGIFVTSFFGWLPKYLPELYPTRIRASGQGFSYNIGRVLAGFGVLGTGTLVSFFHGDYRSGAMIMASVYLLGLMIIQLAPDTGGELRTSEEPEPPTTAFPIVELPHTRADT